jgi:ubiquinone/menaquinone biosynthesis C-methylase UbiE
MKNSNSNIDVVEYYNKHANDPYFENFIFMNDGYVELDADGYPEPVNLTLSEKYKDWKHQVNLYRKLLDLANLNTNTGTLVEVGCGKGGGLSFYKDYYDFKQLIGIDINPAHIEICKSHTTGIEFLTGSATYIPLESEFADIILNVEATAHIDGHEKYIDEVYRVLKPNGLLLQATPLPKNFDFSIFKQRNFDLLLNLDITKNVRMSCSISKFLFFEKSIIIATGLYNDEKLHWKKVFTYNITIFKKK